MKEIAHKKVFSIIVMVFVGVLSLYFLVKTFSVFGDFSFGGSHDKTITLSGYGEVSATPDIAGIYFTIRDVNETSKGAQDKVAEIENKALSVLKDAGVEEKDIKTSNASFYPKYEYKNVLDTDIVTCQAIGCPEPVYNRKRVLVGYEASESINVKIRDLDMVGKIMEDLAEVGVNELNGPNFEIDDRDALEIEARSVAIENAKTKARELVKDLDVRLGKVVSFDEGGRYGGIMPMYKSVSMDSAMAYEEEAVEAYIPEGENIISSSVTVTFKIR